MKVSVNWLKQYVDLGDKSVDQIVQRIGSRLGEVEEVIDYGAAYKGAVAVKIVSAIKHPDADKLGICMVDDGGVTNDVTRNNDGLVQVVCGAPNAKTGLVTAWIPPGSAVPSSVLDNEPFILSARELRGVVSNGMLASENELGLSDNHDGIVDLGALDPKAGSSVAELLDLNDHVIDIENKMFTRRPDCFGILGVAREVAAIFDQQFVSPDWYKSDVLVGAAEDDLLSLGIETDLVPRFGARIMTGVTVKPSSLKAKATLKKVGLKPINNVVDSTNYYAWLTAQPLHAYDYDKVAALSSGKANLVARLAKKGEQVALLNGKTIKLEDDDIVIATDKQVVGLAGIMGGSETEVDEGTTKVIYEAASFNMYAIRRSSMRHGLFTDAVTRFSKDQSALQNQAVLDICSSSVAIEFDYGLHTTKYDIGDYSSEVKQVEVSLDKVNSLLGTSFELAEAQNILAKAELASEPESLKITVPFWRTDLHIAEDIVEEVGRLYGYDNIAKKMPLITAAPSIVDKHLAMKQSVRQILASTGANEALTYSFVDQKLLESCGLSVDNSYTITNALSPTLHYYRQSILPSLLNTVNANIRDGYSEFALFESGAFHSKTHDHVDGIPVDSHSLALVYANAKEQPQSSYYYAANYMDSLLKGLSIDYDLQPMPADIDYQVTKPFNSDRSAFVMVDGQPIGVVGEIKLGIAKKLKLPKACAGFEISLDSLIDNRGVATFKAVPSKAVVKQDLTIEAAPEKVYADVYQQLESKLQDSGLQADVELKDIYKSEQTLNYTFAVTVSQDQKQFTSSQIDEVLASIKSF